MFVAFMFQSSVGGGGGFQSKWVLSRFFGGLVGFVGDWRNFGSNCASAICIRNFFGRNLNSIFKFPIIDFTYCLRQTTWLWFWPNAP